MNLANPSKPVTLRRDIQAMRALAVILVVLFHVAPDRVPGGFIGVDVFFVISGYLITKSLVDQVERRGAISLRRFWLGRLQRLFPAAFVVCGVTFFGFCLVDPLAAASLWSSLRASLLYYANVHFAFGFAGYFASEQPLPFKHFWSLAVEEQFYLAWPALLTLIMVKFRLRDRRKLGRLIASASLISLVVSVALDSRHPNQVFYLTPFRAWELGAGAWLAVTGFSLPSRLKTRPEGVVLAAFIIIVSCGLLFDSRPGLLMVLPIVASVAMIACGDWMAQRSSFMATLVGGRAVGWIGDASYSIYLWHWPVLLFLPLCGLGLSSLTEAVLAAFLFLGLAALSYYFIEGPVRHSSVLRARPRALAVGAALSSVALLAGARLYARTIPYATGELASVTTADDLNSVWRTPSSVPANLIPALPDAQDDGSPIFTNGCSSIDTAENITCEYGDTTSSRTMLLFGDSHAGHWFPAVEQVAIRRGYKLVTMLKMGCPSIELEDISTTPACSAWQRTAPAAIEQIKPDVIVFSNSIYGYVTRSPRDAASIIAEGFERTQARLPKGVKTIIIGDTPRWPEDPNHCLARNLTEPSTCSRDVAEVGYAHYGAILANAASVHHASYIDTLPWFCPEGRCLPITGNRLIYKDSGHLTGSFATLLGARLDSAMAPMLRP